MSVHQTITSPNKARPMTQQRRDQLLTEIYAARLAATVRAERLRHQAHIGKPTQAGHKGGTGPSANSVKLLLAVHRAGRDGFASTSAAFEAAGLKGNGKKAETLRVENRGLITVDRERPAPNMPHILRLTAAGKAELKSRGLIK